MPEDRFGEAVAARYDLSEADMFDPAIVERTVDFLAELGGAGAALELGIGTGRVALPLSRRGVAVHGEHVRLRRHGPERPHRQHQGR